MLNKIFSKNSNQNWLIYNLIEKDVYKNDKIESIAIDIILNTEFNIHKEKKHDEVLDTNLSNISIVETNGRSVDPQKEEREKQTTFERVCRNVIDDQKVNEAIKLLPNNCDTYLLNFLEQGNWHEIAKWDRNILAYQAYDLFRQGKILYTQFATCMFFYTLSKKISIVPLFVDNKNNPLAFDLLCQGLGERDWSFVSKDTIVEFFDNMRNAPESEKYLFFSYEKFANNSGKQSIDDRLREIDFNFLNVCELKLEMPIKKMVLEEKEKIERRKTVVKKLFCFAEDLRNDFLEHEKQLHTMKNDLILEEKKLKILLVNVDLNRNKKLKIKKKECDNSEKLYLEKLQSFNLLRDDFDKIIIFLENQKAKINQVYKDINILENKINKSKMIIHKLQKQEQKRPTQKLRYKGRMVPSLSMMQAFVNGMGKENAITFTPVIGMSTTEDIKNNGRWGTRDIALAFPGTELPDEADSYFIRTPFDFSYHDFYHGSSASLATNTVRLTCIQIAEIVASKSKNELMIANYPELANFFIEILIDMEMSTYFPGSLCSDLDSQDRETVQMLQHLDSKMSLAIDLYRRKHPKNFKKIKNHFKEIVEEIVHILIKKGLIAPSVSLDTRILVNWNLRGNFLNLFTSTYINDLNKI